MHSSTGPTGRRVKARVAASRGEAVARPDIGDMVRYGEKTGPCFPFCHAGTVITVVSRCPLLDTKYKVSFYCYSLELRFDKKGTQWDDPV